MNTYSSYTHTDTHACIHTHTQASRLGSGRPFVGGRMGGVKDVRREISVLWGPEVTLMVSYISPHKAMQSKVVNA